MRATVKVLLGIAALLAGVLGGTVGLYKLGGWIAARFGWGHQPIAQGPRDWAIGLAPVAAIILGGMIGHWSDWPETLMKWVERRLPKPKPPSLEDITRATEKSGAERAIQFVEKR